MHAITADLLQFIAASPTPFHAVHSAVARLAAVGFTPVSETASWRDLAPGRYYLTRGDSALLAFILPAGSGAAPGFRIIGAHTDSPNLRLKPRPAYHKEGYLQLGVEVYGGALLNSWVDRDLNLAGRVICRDPASGGLVSRLVLLPQPILRVPQLAIHLDREVNEKGLTLNRQEHLAPILGLSATPCATPHEPIHALCAAALGVAAEDIVGTDLMLHERTPPTTAGLSQELVLAPRLDNLAMCHAALMALAQAADAADQGPLIPLLALFDHEEVGSDSAYGAGAPLLPAVLERLVLARGGDRDAFHQSVARSLCVSADMAHAVHPNYPDRHEARHRPVLNGGPVIKINSQQRYATCARTAALFRALCQQAEVPVQHYAHRTDLPCGSTIGPITATLLGIRTVDVGNPMLSMHSAREMAGANDPELMVRALHRFLLCDDPFPG